MSDASVRKRNSDRTQQLILEAAQEVFSRQPYAEASLKEITSQAGASVALVSRYFGSKEQLFQAALAEALDVEQLTNVNRENFGEAVARLFTGKNYGRVNPLPMMVYASAQTATRDAACRLVHDRVLAPLGAWIGGARGEMLAAQIMAVATGYFTYRIILPLQPFEGGGGAETEAWLAQTLQAIIDGAAPD